MSEYPYYTGPNTMPCPYGFDTSIANVVWTKELPGPGMPTVAMIEPHAISHPALTGMCPASLMKLPLDAASTRHLLDQERADQRRVDAWHESRMNREQAPEVENESQPVGEIGSHPADSPGWVLGGREDEDVIPATEMVVPPLPQGVAGYKVGGAMAGADSTAAQVNAAGAYAQEAIQSLNLANDKLDETRRIGMEAGGENPGDTMRAYMRAMEIAQEEIAKAISSINTGLDFGQAYIQRLYS